MGSLDTWGQGTPEEEACFREVSMVWLRDFADNWDKDQREWFIKLSVDMDKQRRVRRSRTLSWAAIVMSIVALTIAILKTISVL